MKLDASTGSLQLHKTISLELRGCFRDWHGVGLMTDQSTSDPNPKWRKDADHIPT
jgi:hypothetical protein